MLHKILPAGVLMVAFALILAPLTGPSRAAPEEDTAPAQQRGKGIDDVLIPIPFSADVGGNGCHLRATPAEQQGDDLARVPFWHLIDHAARGYSVRLTIDGADKFTARIAPLDDDVRRLVLLFTLWDSMSFRGDGLPLFFEGRAGAIAPAVRDALQAAGLRELDAFSRAMALFGDSYPVDVAARKKFFAEGRPDARLGPFDRRMLGLAAQFGSRDSLSKSIIAHVERTPALWGRIESLREKLPESDRLAVLADALAGNIDLWQPYAEVERKLAALSPPQRTLFAMAVFNEEFKNGGVDQFFYNSSGAIAPEVYDALIALGLERQAAIFKRGLDLFGTAYIRDTQQRRDLELKGHGKDKQLSALTDELYALDGGPKFYRVGGMTVEGGPGIDEAMINYAREHHLLPC